MIKEIVISLDEHILDPLTMNQTAIVSGIFRGASDILNNGGKVIVQRKYRNAPPHTIATFSKQEELVN